MNDDFDKKLQNMPDATYILGQIKGLLKALDIIIIYGDMSKQAIRDLVDNLSNNPLVKESLKNKGVLI